MRFPAAPLLEISTSLALVMALCVFYEFLVVIKTMIPTHNRPLELFSLLKISLLMIVTLTQYSHRVLPSAQF